MQSKPNLGTMRDSKSCFPTRCKVPKLPRFLKRSSRKPGPYASLNDHYSDEELTEWSTGIAHKLDRPSKIDRDLSSSSTTSITEEEDFAYIVFDVHNDTMEASSPVLTSESEGSDDEDEDESSCYSAESFSIDEVFPAFTKPISPLRGKHTSMSTSMSTRLSHEELRTAPDWGPSPWIAENDDDKAAENVELEISWVRNAQGHLEEVGPDTEFTHWVVTPKFNHLPGPKPNIDAPPRTRVDVVDVSMFEGVDVDAFLPEVNQATAPDRKGQDKDLLASLIRPSSLTLMSDESSSTSSQRQRQRSIRFADEVDGKSLETIYNVPWSDHDDKNWIPRMVRRLVEV